MQVQQSLKLASDKSCVIPPVTSCYTMYLATIVIHSASISLPIWRSWYQSSF